MPREERMRPTRSRPPYYGTAANQRPASPSASLDKTGDELRAAPFLARAGNDMVRLPFAAIVPWQHGNQPRRRVWQAVAVDADSLAPTPIVTAPLPFPFPSFPPSPPFPPPSSPPPSPNIKRTQIRTIGSQTGCRVRGRRVGTHGPAEPRQQQAANQPSPAQRARVCGLPCSPPTPHPSIHTHT